MRKKPLLLVMLILALSLMTTACNPSPEEIFRYGFEQAATQTAGTQQALASRSVFLETPADSLAANLVGAPLGGVPDTIIASGSDTAIPTAFGTNPINGDLAFVKYDQTQGMRLQIYSAADGSTRQLAGPDQFFAVGVGTMVQYSPDGNAIALTIATLPTNVALTTLDIETTELTDGQLGAIQYRAYVANVGDGIMTQIVAEHEVAFSMLDWNQSGTQVALNGWSDDNGDGKITFYPDSTTREFSDSTQIYVYDVPSNTTTQVTDADLNYAPTYVGDDLLWLTFEQEGNIGIIKTENGSVYGGDNIIVAMAASPDNSQVAWIEVPTNTERTALTGAPLLQVSDAAFENEPLVAELPGMIIPDTPEWTPDNQYVLVSATNILEKLAPEYAGAFGVSLDAVEVPAAPSILQVNVQSGEMMPVYAGSIVNSGTYPAMINLIASGVLE